MSALLGALLAGWWPHIVAGIAAVAGIFGVYLKGKSDQKQKAKLDDLSAANEIRKAGADARANAAAGGLRDNDGWRRD